MTNEIKLEKREPTFDYILNDLAFDSLMFRVVNGIGSNQDKFDFDYQIKLMQKEISRLRKNIYNANSILNKLVVMKPWENTDDPMRKIYRPIKNTTKQEVYRAIVELENILQGDE